MSTSPFRPHRRRRPLRAGIAALTAVALGAAGCTNSEEIGIPPEPPPSVEAVPEIAAMVPESIANTGAMVVGTNTPYAPNEFKNDAGEIIGFDIEIIDVVAETMGLRADIREADFEKIIPSIESGTFDAGISSMTVTAEREEVVDMARYFMGGTQWAARADRDVDPDNACGLRVAVQRTTVQDTDDIPARSEKCVAEGKPAIEKIQYDEQDQVGSAVVLGQVDAMSADSPVSAFVVEKAEGQVELVGDLVDAEPYGIALAKDSPLGEAVVAALRHLADSGVLATIAERWGVQEGLLTEEPSLG